MKKISFLSLACAAALAACSSGLDDTLDYEQSAAYKRHLDANASGAYKVSRQIGDMPAQTVTVAPEPAYAPAMPEPTPPAEQPVTRATSMQPVTGSADTIFDDRLRK